MPPVKKTKLADAVVEEVLKAIETGRFKPGEKIPSEKVLTKEFGVSRTTLREAFQKLEAMGKMSIRQGDGTYLNEKIPSHLYTHLKSAFLFSDTDVTMFLEARECLEMFAAQLAANRATEEDIAKLNEILRLQEENLHDKEKFSEFDFKFHQVLLEASKNPILIQFWNLILGLIRVELDRITGLPGITEQAWKDHKRIAKAIAQKEARRAQTVMREHLSLVQGSVLPQLTSRINSQE